MKIKKRNRPQREVIQEPCPHCTQTVHQVSCIFKLKSRIQELEAKAEALESQINQHEQKNSDCTV